MKNTARGALTLILIGAMITCFVCCSDKKSTLLENMIRIPAGPFLMGSSDEEIMKVVRDLGGGELGPDVQWFAAERPQHEAQVEEFYIDKRAVYWDGNNEMGESVASGVYFYHINSGNFSAVRKMLVAR